MEGWTELDYKKMMEQEFGVRLDKKMSISSKESGKLIISDGTYLLHKSDRNSECIEPESTSNKVQKDYFYVWDVCQIYK